MGPNIYEETLAVRTSNADHMGTWRASAICAAMQEICGTHSELLGCGFHAMLAKHRAWVLTRIALEMAEHPVIGDTVRVVTWPAPIRRWFFPRYFTLYGARGNVLGHMATLWVAMDTRERRMLPPDDLVPLLPDNSALTPPLALPGAVQPLAAAPREYAHAPAYSDLDVNGHVNNTRYVDWACDALGIEALTGHRVSSLLVNYHAEILPGDGVTLAFARAGDAFTLSGLRADKRHFDLSGTLAAR